MSNNYLVLDPITRRLITVVEPNNNSAPLLDDLVFRDSVVSINFSLSATETQDTISATLQSIVSGILTSTDTIDTIDATFENIVSWSLNVTDSKDTAEIESESIISMSIQSTDTKDVSNITATVDTSLTVETTDTQDKAKFYLSGTESKKVQGAYLDPLLYKLFLKRSAKLNVKENKDVAIFEVEHVKQVIFNITEKTDRAVAIFKAPAISQFAILENITDSMYVDEAEFKIKVDEIYNRYEQEQILAILSAA